MTKAPPIPLLCAVTIRFQFPAHDERDGITYEVAATTKREAISTAKRKAAHDGHISKQKGRTTFKATWAIANR